MCHRDTRSRLPFQIGTALALLLSLSGAAVAQQRLDWRRIADASVELGLASPATGPMESVWFSPDGARLYARTASGRVLETGDFQNWTPAVSPPAKTDAGVAVSVARLPSSGARLTSSPANPARVYAIGRQLFRSDDGGRSWEDLTSYKDASVIGGAQRDLAISPVDPQQLVVANERGVWRSLDGGMSWSGLNEALPNLPVRRILATPGARQPVRILADAVGELEMLPGGGHRWQPVAAPSRAQTFNVPAKVTAWALAGDIMYVGAEDGRIFTTVDGGANWTESRAAGAGMIEALYVDLRQPRVALAALGAAPAGAGPRVLRTTNGGLIWDDLSANLPDAPAHGITADRQSGAIYVATDRGIYYTRGDLDNPGPATAWTRVTGNLPDNPARDVQLNSFGTQLYAAIDGYGVYAAAAPHLRQSARLVNAADFSARAAAPGSLLSVLGSQVKSARGAGLDFPVLAASEGGSQIQVPFEVSGPAVSLAVEGAAGKMDFGLPVQPVSPAIFVSEDGWPTILDGESGLLLDARNTARSNARIQLLATGLGKVRPDWPTGMAPPLENVPTVVTKVDAFLDRAPVEVTRATLAPGLIGYYLVELQLPALVNAGPAELFISAGGQESNRVRIYLEP